MKDFFKYLLATVVGILVTGLFFSLIFFGIIGAMIAKSDKTVEVKENSLLILKFEGQIVDRGTNNPMADFDFMSLSPVKNVGLNDILKGINNAAEDPKIKGIFIENIDIPAGSATIEEIRNALIKFKESGKFIISYSNVYSQKSYYLSSVADKILMNPEGQMEWAGLRSEIMFYKNAFDKLGVEMQVIRHGKFKSFAEPYMYDKMSPENREQIMTYIGSIWNHWIDGIGKERNLTPEQLNAMADNFTVRNAKSAVESGLIDSLVYKDQVIDLLKSLTDTKPEKDINAVGISQYAKVPLKKENKEFTRDKIAVIYASGSIIDGESQGEGIAGDHYGRVIREARRDSTVKAIVLRINSGGGSALASDVIWREMSLAKQVKPVIVSMGDVAASGGYNIAAPADVIVANPTTITGSIGVIGIIPNVKDGMNKKLGITVDVAKTNKYSDMMTIFRPLSAEEKSIIQMGIVEVYNTFIGHVSEGRGITTEQVDEIGQGRVWSGINAMDIKLIDEFGGLEHAISIAAEKANLENYRISELPKLEDPFEVLIKQLTGGAKAKLLEDELGLAYKEYKNMLEMVKNRGIQARMPYNLEVY